MGVICIGLLALGAVLYLSSEAQSQDDIVAVPRTATVEVETLTPTLTPSATASPTPEPTTTPTPVVNTDPEVIVTVEEEVAPTEEATEEVPPTIDPNITPSNVVVVQTPTSQITPISPTVEPDLVPASGAVLSVTDNPFLVWVGGSVLILLFIFGGISIRLKS